MPRVFTRCRNSGQPVPTQLVMDEQTFQTIRVPVFQFTCRSCGRVHAWAQQDSWVERSAPPRD